MNEVLHFDASSSDCTHPRSPALAPGLIAAGALVMAHTVNISCSIPSTATRCAKNRSDSRSRPAAAGQPTFVMGQPQSPRQRSQDPVLE
ncbi:hypothetical protein AgCh_029614 [Apium graveolens]